MRVIAKKILRDFWEKNPIAEQPLKTWYKEASKAQWDNTNEIKNAFITASVLKSGRVVINICGNRFRLIVDINYERKSIFIRFIGSHKDYDNIDANKI